MKLTDVQNLQLSLVKEVFQQHMRKYGYTPMTFAVGSRNFSFNLRRYSSCSRDVPDEYVLILREDDVIFIMKDYDDVPPTSDEIWDMIVNRYKQLKF